jgi:hypothetical protein
MSAATTLAQKVTVDHQLWLGVSCKLDFKKGWAFTAQYRRRQINDYNDYSGSYLFLTTDYKINKYLNTFIDYRYAVIIDAGYYHRFALGIEGQFKKKDFTFSLRPMVQRQNQYFLGDEGATTDASLYLRPRGQIKFKATKRLDFYVYGEPFLNVYNSWKTGWVQSSLGLKYEYLKNQKINLYYIWNGDYTKKYDRTYHIFGIDLEFTLKVGKRIPKVSKKKKENL